MHRDNVLRSGNFYMKAGDVLHLLFEGESGSSVTVTLNAGDDFETIPSAPVATTESDRTLTSFTANWVRQENTLGYYLDVATDSAFTAFVAGYNSLDVEDTDSCSVIGLSACNHYYYRLRAYNDGGTSPDSNVIDARTLYNDWFLPTYLLYNEMYNNLVGLSGQYGLGGFDCTSPTGKYWASVELNMFDGFIFKMYDGVFSADAKNITHKIRPCRSFTAPVGTYSLRDEGQADGLICYINGTTYYEAAPADIVSTSVWSNLWGFLLGTTSIAINESRNNTNEIIAQAGHTTSAALLCVNYTA